MSNEQVIDIVHLKADADLSSYQYHMVKFSTTGVALASTGGDCMGILQNDPEQGEAATVRVAGESFCYVDGNAGAIAVGGWLTSEATTADGVVTTTDNTQVCAFALEASTADGDKIKVMCVPFGRY